jgi:hypothetical protein
MSSHAKRIFNEEMDFARKCFVGYSLRRQILWRLALYITVLLVAWWLSAPWKAVSSSLATNGTQSLSSGLEPVAFGNT